jgi:GT2 family glycosyltransferase
MLAMNRAHVAIIVPTFERSQMLAQLCEDVICQTTPPLCLIIVDGNPISGEVLNCLGDWTKRRSLPVHYVPSNHANLPYQRYLGWRVGVETEAAVLLYLDDDLRVFDRDAVSKLAEPLLVPGSNVVGCTAEIAFGDSPVTAMSEVLKNREQSHGRWMSWLVRTFGSSHNLHPGCLAPSGHRVPVRRSGCDVFCVEWLRGGVMAYRADAFTEECFSHDLFALYEARLGRGEDTFLSHRLAAKGSLLTLNNTHIVHPNLDPPKAYPTGAFRMGVSTAYSRRLLNDNYRWPGRPRVSDRAALLKSYAGTAMLNVIRALRSPKSHRFAYAWGYFCGALKGVFQPPSHQRLTPHIDWQKDAEAAVRCRVGLALRS